VDLPKLYPMTPDVQGTRTYEEYLDAMANLIVSITIDYRLPYRELRKLVDYAEANHYRLNR
jgi:hypothetical protein